MNNRPSLLAGRKRRIPSCFSGKKGWPKTLRNFSLKSMESGIPVRAAAPTNKAATRPLAQYHA